MSRIVDGRSLSAAAWEDWGIVRTALAVAELGCLVLSNLDRVLADGASDTPLAVAARAELARREALS